MEEVIKNIEKLSYEQVQKLGAESRQSIDQFNLAPVCMYLHALLKHAPVSAEGMAEKRDDIIQRLDHIYFLAGSDARVHQIKLDSGADSDGVLYAPPDKTAIHIWMVILAPDSAEPSFYYHPRYENDIARIQADLYVGFYKTWNYAAGLQDAKERYPGSIFYNLIRMSVSPGLQSFMDIQSEVMALWPDLHPPKLNPSISSIPVINSGGARLTAICQYA